MNNLVGKIPTVGVFCGEQAAVYGNREAALTPEIFRRVLQMKLREHEQRRQFEQNAGEEQPQQQN